MIIKDSLKYDQYGRKRKVKKSGSVTKYVPPDFKPLAASENILNPERPKVPSAPLVASKVHTGRQERQVTNHTVAPAFNKGGYQVIPESEIKFIGRK